MKKMAVCVGINDYPGYINDLRGCVRDAKAWSAILQSKYDFDPPTVLLEFQATIQNVTTAVTKMINSATPDSHLVWTYSGHGTSIENKRPDKTDGRAEAIVLYDGLLLDSTIRSLLEKLPRGVRMTIISDSCHSGTLSRMQRLSRFRLQGADYPNPRYMPPEAIKFAKSVRQIPTNGRVFRLINEQSMPEILISGCTAIETARDACIDGQFNGAMSYYALKILNENPRLTYNEFYAKLRSYLPSAQYNQTPQLEGSDAAKARIIFS